VSNRGRHLKGEHGAERLHACDRSRSETYEVRADGELLICEPARSCRWRSVISCSDYERALRIEPAGHWPREAAHASVTLDHDARHRRRLRLATDAGEPCSPSISARGAMGDGDGLALEDGAGSRSAPRPKCCSKGPRRPSCCAASPAYRQRAHSRRDRTSPHLIATTMVPPLPPCCGSRARACAL